MLVFYALGLTSPMALASDVSIAGQLSAVYNPSTKVTSIYYGDNEGHLNEIQVNSSSVEIAHYDLTELDSLPTITSPTVSAVYSSISKSDLVFYLSGTSTENVVMISEISGPHNITVSYPSGNNFIVNGSAEPANQWQSVWAAVDNSGNVDYGLQIINGQDDPDTYGPRGYVFTGGAVGNFANSNVNIYGQIGRDPEHLQQQVQVFYDPNWAVFIAAFDPEGEGHIHTVAYNPATDYYYSEDLMNTTGSVHMDDTANGSGGSVAVCTPSGFSFATNGNDAELYYYGGDGNMHEIASTSPGSWGSLDITKSANSPQIQQGCGPISAVYNSFTGETDVAYTSPNDSTPTGYQLNVITGAVLGSWSFPYTVTGAGSPINSTPMSSTTDSSGNADTYYIGTDSSGYEHLYELIGNNNFNVVMIGN